MRPSPIFLGIVAVTVLGGVLCALGTSSFVATTGVVLLVLGGWGVSLCLHEFGHAYLALRGGDYSVRAKGYLNLDPRRYTDPVFSLVLPLVFLIIGGIPLPGGAVWINHHALRDKRAESFVSLAGPGANLILGVLIALALRVIQMPAVLAAGLAYLALLQIVAFIINILPIPGLDGWGAIEPYLSYQARELGAKVRPWAPMVLFVLLIGVPSVTGALFDAAMYISHAVAGDHLGFGSGFQIPFANLAYEGQQLFMFWR